MRATPKCVEALEEALSRYGRPEIFDTDQGSQFTSADFTGTLKRHRVTISMDGKGRCMADLVHGRPRSHWPLIIFDFWLSSGYVEG
jgi:transposase InsO family protein